MNSKRTEEEEEEESCTQADEGESLATSLATEEVKPQAQNLWHKITN